MILKYTEVIRVLVILLLGTAAVKVHAQEGVVVDKIIAKVDDKIILKSELEEAYLQFLSSGQSGTN